MIDGKALLKRKQDEYTAAKSNLETGLSDPVFVSAVLKESSNQPLTADEQAKRRRVDDLKLKHDAAETALFMLESTASATALARAQNVFKPDPLRWHDSEWKCGQTGRERVDLKRSHKHESSHDVRYQNIEYAVGTSASRANDTMEQLNQRLDMAQELAAEGKIATEEYAKKLRVVCEAGWDVANHMEQPEFCDTPEEVREFAKAVKSVSALRSAKAAKGKAHGQQYRASGNGFHGSGFRGSNVPPMQRFGGNGNPSRFGGAPTGGHGGQGSGIQCYKCRGFGHVAASCPGKGA